MDKIKMVKKDAQITIKIGTGFLQKLQKVMVAMAADLTPEQLELYKTEAQTIKNGEEFTEPWMDSITTISLLLREIESEADKQGFIYEGDINDAIQSES